MPDEYTADEGDGEIKFRVVVISGQPSREVVIEFFTETGSAVCKSEYVAVLLPEAQATLLG